MRFLLRLVVLVILIGVAGAYFFGYRWSDVRDVEIEAPVATSGSTINTESARRAGAQIAEKVAEGANQAEKALSEASLTAKIKSKMALDDTIDASRVNVDTTGTIVTLRGSVPTETQHKRVVQLARETAGVTSVVDRVEVPGR